MESFFSPSSEDLRMNSSPRRSPQIKEGLATPVKSVQALTQKMDLTYGEPDAGLRTTDFFEYSSDDESTKAASREGVAVDAQLLPDREKPTKKQRSRNSNGKHVAQADSETLGPIEPSREGYQPLAASLHQEVSNQPVGTPSSSPIGSVAELLPNRNSDTPHFPPQPNLLNGGTKRNTMHTESSIDRTSKIDQTLGAYAIAHDITLQALLRDESAFSCFPLATYQPSNRLSGMPELLSARPEITSLRNRPISSPPETKKVHVVPPPIDTAAPRRSIIENIVRTPFPFSPESASHNRDSNPLSSTESILTVSIRQSNPNSRRRTTSLTIPASNDFSVVRSHSPRSKEQHFRALDYDDTMFFHQLRRCYAELMGPIRVCSARSLRHISVHGQAMKAADRGYWLHPPQSPHLHTQKSTKLGIMHFYRKPILGKQRYAFVHWAHRLAATSPDRTFRPLEDSPDSPVGDVGSPEEQTDGLEFIVSWSFQRIAIAFLVVVATSIAATLLWIFLGRVTPARFPDTGGYRDAGDRLASGATLGICLLLLGLSSIAGWLGVSWLVM